MKILTFESDFNIIKELILSGEILCSPTDTQYGLIGSALNVVAIETAYRLKKRDQNKPLIVLFNSVEKLKKYGVFIPEKYENFLKEIWPERLTVILPLNEESPFKTLFNRSNLAVRIPAFKPLRELISETVPLFAPSANIQGEKPAESCRECHSYFKGQVKYCIKGRSTPIPSTLLSLIGSAPEILREGAVSIETIKKRLSEVRMRK
ncbi:L-threonylcarbamoyladenylate synthase [Desulfurobacterium sp.]